MALGMSAAWRAMQPKKKRCERCGLYYTEKLNKCSHCGDLDDSGLQALLERHEEEFKGNASLGKFFILGAVVIGVLLLLTIK
jgi:hypothetical protein